MEVENRLPFAFTVAVLLLCASAARDTYVGTSLEGWMPVDFDWKTASYQVEGNTVDNRGWMRRIPDSTPLSAMSIPGTHDSLAWDIGLPPSERCQNFILERQLVSGGIRYLDIPLRMDNGGGGLYGTGDVGPSNMFWEDMKTRGRGPSPLTKRFGYDGSITGRLARFLNIFRSETIIVRFRIDPRDAAQRDAMRRRFWVREYAFFSQDYFWVGSDITKWPTLGEVRGKVVIITDFGEDDLHDSDKSVQWGSNIIRTDRNWDIRSLSDMEGKWLDVNRHLDKALRSVPNVATEGSNRGGEDGRLYITHLAGGGPTISPEVVAAGGSRMLLDSRVGPKPIKKKMTLEDIIRKVFKKKPKEDPKEQSQATAGPNKPKSRPNVANVGFNTVQDPKRVEGMNARTLRKLQGWQKAKGFRKTGVVVMDFPNYNLTQAIIALNFVV